MKMKFQIKKDWLFNKDKNKMKMNNKIILMVLKKILKWDQENVMEIYFNVKEKNHVI